MCKNSKKIILDRGLRQNWIHLETMYVYTTKKKQKKKNQHIPF